MGKLLINERVDSGSASALLLSRLSDVFLPEMFATCVRLAFQRAHLDLQRATEERQGDVAVHVEKVARVMWRWSRRTICCITWRDGRLKIV